MSVTITASQIIDLPDLARRAIRAWLGQHEKVRKVELLNATGRTARLTLLTLDERGNPQADPDRPGEPLEHTVLYEAAEPFPSAVLTMLD